MVQVYLTALIIFEVSAVDDVAVVSFLLSEELPLVHAENIVAAKSVHAMIPFCIDFNFVVRKILRLNKHRKLRVSDA
jgi:hypothetical protein